VPYLSPTLDGRDTHFYEWRNAELYDAASDQGAEHRTSGAIRRVLFGLNESDLFLRVDGVGAGGSAGRALRLRFTLPRPIEARAPISDAPSGPLAWTPAGPADPGEYVAGSLTEIRVPLARLQAEPKAVLRWSVALEESGEVVEVIPRAGELAVPALEADFDARNWMAT
jgi:hypothetical protein